MYGFQNELLKEEKPSLALFLILAIASFLLWNYNVVEALKIYHILYLWWYWTLVFDVMLMLIDLSLSTAGKLKNCLTAGEIESANFVFLIEKKIKIYLDQWYTVESTCKYILDNQFVSTCRTWRILFRLKY